MTNEREPLWSDERIEALAGNFTDELDGGAGTYHLFCVAMGNVRDDYEARIAELEQKLSRAAQYKGAEAYPCPLCRYEDGIFVESCAMHNRIAELETQLAQTWQPVSANFILTHDTGLIGRPKQFVRWNADDESVIVGEDDGNFHHCPLPANIRLCRLVESQPPYAHRNGETEPPTVDGWYWWSGTVIGAYAEKGLVNITVPRNDANIQIWPSWCDGWLGAKDMQGQWYGPIVPPWEDCHE